ncbi:hypothetical protein L1987_01083 [Smallanthus sonchifolius]|uniref:Uncharacterized protein n=1 Tax=Smallanthus sonchifolius TaxID=185202 RepID=A0ACB9K445_9ASTR|nr:hypothetical protein L1987_01083 [Smallanthus sonchifolius]
MSWVPLICHDIPSRRGGPFLVDLVVCSYMKLYTPEEATTQFGADSVATEAVDWVYLPDDLEEQEWIWGAIGVGEYNKKIKATQIKDPLHRYLHRLIGHTIFGRGTRGVVTLRDMFFLYCILTPVTCNVAYSLARYLTTSGGTCGKDYVWGAVSASVSPEGEVRRWLRLEESRVAHDENILTSMPSLNFSSDRLLMPISTPNVCKW